MVKNIFKKRTGIVETFAKKEFNPAGQSPNKSPVKELIRRTRF